MSDFETINSDDDEELLEFIHATHGGVITGMYLSEDNDAIGLELADGKIIEAAPGC
ncbi:MAG: hypothetical protein ACLQVJ_03335 [Syntrophobacteraceae bacterium]